MIVNILSSEIKERAIILTVKTVGFLARMGYNISSVKIHQLLYNIVILIDKFKSGGAVYERLYLADI